MFFAIDCEFLVYFVGVLTFHWFFSVHASDPFRLFLVEEFVFSLPLSTLIRKTHKRGFSGGIYVF